MALGAEKRPLGGGPTPKGTAENGRRDLMKRSRSAHLSLALHPLGSPPAVPRRRRRRRPGGSGGAMGAQAGLPAAVGLQEGGKTLFITLKRVASHQGGDAQDDGGTYVLRVLDAVGGRAWESDMAFAAVQTAMRKRDKVILEAPCVDTALALCLEAQLLRLVWSAAAQDGERQEGEQQLHLEAWYDRKWCRAIPPVAEDDGDSNLPAEERPPSPVLFRLPPQGDMQPQRGEALRRLNAVMLEEVLQHGAALRARAELAERKLEALRRHAEAVHDSYRQVTQHLTRVDLVAPGPPHALLDSAEARAASEAPAASAAPQQQLAKDAAWASQLSGSQTQLPEEDARSAEEPVAAGGTQQLARAGSSSMAVVRHVRPTARNGKAQRGARSARDAAREALAAKFTAHALEWGGRMAQVLAAQDACSLQEALVAPPARQRVMGPPAASVAAGHEQALLMQLSSQGSQQQQQLSLCATQPPAASEGDAACVGDLAAASQQQQAEGAAGEEEPELLQRVVQRRARAGPGGGGILPTAGKRRR